MVSDEVTADDIADDLARDAAARFGFEKYTTGWKDVIEDPDGTNPLKELGFEETKRIVPNHVIDVPDPNVMVGIDCEPLPVEMVVRAYITGVTSTRSSHPRLTFSGRSFSP